MSKTWFITGATRGLGADIAAAALKAIRPARDMPSGSVPHWGQRSGESLTTSGCIGHV